MVAKIQNFLFNFILFPLSKFMGNFSSKTKDRIFVVSAFLLFCNYFVYSFFRATILFDLRYFYVFVIGCFLSGVMILCSLPSDFVPIKLNWWICLPGIGFGICALISGFVNDTNHFSQAILALIVFPIVFLVWNSVDVFKIFKLLIKGCRWSFYLFLIIHFILYPIEGRQYEGMFYNTNGMSAYLTVVFCCLLVEIYAVKTKKKFWLNATLLAIVCAYLYYTGSRTGLLSAAMAVLVFLIIILLFDFKNSINFCIKRLSLIALSLVVIVPSVIVASQISDKTVDWVSSFVIENNNGAQNPNNETDKDLGNTSNKGNNQNWKDILNEIKETNEDRMNTDDKTLASYSTGRLGIWEGFIKELNFSGHSDSYSFKIEVGDRIYETPTAHNNILQYSYSFGILSGLLYMAFNIFAGIKSVIYAFKNKNQPYALLPLIITIAFGVTSLLASIGSFNCMLAYYYYLLQAPLIKKINTHNTKA